jgi:glutaminase
MEDFSQKMLEDSSKLKTRCAGLNTEINRLLEAHKALPPDKKRNEYNRMMNIIDNKMNESNREITYLVTSQKEINKNISDTIDCYNKIGEVLQNFIKLYNTVRVGTLEGLSRQAVRNYKIPANDSMTAEILTQQYTEPSGGKKSKKRRVQKKRTRSRK